MLGIFHIYRELLGQIADVPEKETWTGPLKVLRGSWDLTGSYSGNGVWGPYIGIGGAIQENGK